MKKLLTLLCFSLVTLPFLANAIEFNDGEQYYSIKPTPTLNTGEEVELVEFFWYGCPHCYHFNKPLEAWLKTKKPANVTFQPVPVIFPGNPATTLHAETFYALELMGERKRMHSIIFAKMHKERKNLNKLKDIKKLLKENGIDTDKFEKVMKSFAVQSKVRRSTVLARRYGVNGVPSLIVDGRYRSGGGMKTYDEMMELVTFLNTKVLAERPKIDD